MDFLTFKRRVLAAARETLGKGCAACPRSHAHSPRACSAFARRPGIADLRTRSSRAQGGLTRARLPRAAHPRQDASVAATRRLAAGPTALRANGTRTLRFSGAASASNARPLPCYLAAARLPATRQPPASPRPPAGTPPSRAACRAAAACRDAAQWRRRLAAPRCAPPHARARARATRLPPRRRRARHKPRAGRYVPRCHATAARLLTPRLT